MDTLPLIERAEVRPDWLAAHEEPILEPDLPIIDPHHHLSDSHWGGYLEDDLLRDLGAGHRIESTVFVQVGFGYRQDGPDALRPVGETEAVAAIARKVDESHVDGLKDRPRICAGIVAHADLRLGCAVDEVLAAHAEAGQGRLRGIRCGAAAHAKFRYGVMPAPPLHLYEDPAFRAGYARLADWGLGFDSWAYHTQLGELHALAREHPDIPVVIDHIGVPLGVGPCAHQRKQVFDDWHRQMAALASLPHVCVKLGGLGMSVFGFDFHLRHQPPNSLELAMAWGPYIRACIDLFGPGRCMFESNFPVDKGTCSYPVLWNAFKRIATGMSKEDKAMLFAGTAARVYRLG